MAKVAVLGHGVVGSGVVELLMQNAELISQRSGEKMEVKYVLDLREFSGLPYSNKFTKDFQDILNDSEVSVVAEAIGGIEPAYTFTKKSLLAGKSVVSSNKELVAEKGAELLAIAKENNTNYLFEASVGGGIPVIRPIHQCLVANKINSITGILNGTTNFILTKMESENMSFADALKIAKELGYAESDPTADIEGDDACRKICILASMIFGYHVYPKYIEKKGISGITLEDMQYANGIDSAIKLIGYARLLGTGKVDVRVSPTIIPKCNLLANIHDVFNGILVDGDATGETLFYGKGAGKFPTASAVIADMVACANANGTIPTLTWEESTENNVANHREQSAQNYVRLTGSAMEIAEQFGEVTMLSRKNQPENEFAFVTAAMQVGEFDDRLAELKSKGCTILSTIPLIR